EDLKSNSPYNTYKNKGLPPTPISNPGYDSLLAVLTPESSPFWFYLSDKDHIIHYAKTLEEHTANRLKYLNK
ncbi:MAG: endolytic transglycosylase MltG, partial [bacterium]|nr:endolytic transglycosylase MltG [bacterium]